MKELNFKFSLYFLPAFGLIYVIWYGFKTVFGKSVDNMYKKLNKRSELFYLLFILYMYVHIVTISLIIFLIIKNILF